MWGQKKLYGKEFMGIIRSAFLIDEKGKVDQAWYKISPKDTPKKLLAALARRLERQSRFSSISRSRSSNSLVGRAERPTTTGGDQAEGERGEHQPAQEVQADRLHRSVRSWWSRLEFDASPGWRNGRRGGLKIRCPKGRVGSNPTPGTQRRRVSAVTKPPADVVRDLVRLHPCLSTDIIFVVAFLTFFIGVAVAAIITG